jgi:hypothetical protein
MRTPWLLDSSALWRVLREAELRAAWTDVVSAGAVGSCHPQRVEFRRSARTIDEFEQMTEMFAALYPDDDNDVAAAARYLPDLRERNIRDTPKAD